MTLNHFCLLYQIHPHLWKSYTKFITRRWQSWKETYIAITYVFRILLFFNVPSITRRLWNFTGTSIAKYSSAEVASRVWRSRESFSCYWKLNRTQTGRCRMADCQKLAIVQFVEGSSSPGNSKLSSPRRLSCVVCPTWTVFGLNWWDFATRGLLGHMFRGYIQIGCVKKNYTATANSFFFSPVALNNKNKFGCCCRTRVAG